MVNSPPKEEQTDEENDLFYFESDHLAVKGNKDYSELVKTLFVLQAQQKQAAIDYEKVVEIHKEVLGDPLLTLERLKKGDDLGIPPLQRVIEVPNINWSKYNVNVPYDELKGNEISTKKELQLKLEPDLSVRSPHKKKAWTTEEQKRLEELLVIYPPEEIEIRRFKKIAAALGNRTTQQVCSRVQKYFVKLHKAGLPIPGRIPKSIANKYKKSHKHQRFNHYLWKPTTFFPELNIPVVMNDIDDVPGPSSNSYPCSERTSNYLIPGTYHETSQISGKSDAENQLEILKRVRQEKENEGTADLFVHVGYRCNHCNDEPIHGSRWHCTTCSNASVDFCTDCMVAQMYSDNCHPLAHLFVALRDDKSESYSDSESSSCSTVRNNESADEVEGESDDGASVGAMNGSRGKESNGNSSESRDSPYSYLHSHIFGDYCV